MWVFILKATLEINQRTTKPLLVQIHLTMLPTKRIRFRTRAKPADNAMFAEEFFCKVSTGLYSSLGRTLSSIEHCPLSSIRIYSNPRYSFSIIF